MKTAKTREAQKTCKQLLRFASPYRGMILLGALLSCLTVLSNIGLMTFSAFLLSWASLAPPVLALMTTIAAVRFFGLSRAVFRYLERYLNHRTTLNILSSVRVWLYRAIEKKNPGQLAGEGEDRLFSRLTADVEALKDFYLRVLLPPLTAILVMLGVSALLFALKPSLSFIFILFYLLAGLGLPLLQHRWSKQENLPAGRAELETLLADSLHGMTDLLAFGQEKSRLARLRAESGRFTARQERWAGKEALISIATTLLSQLAALLIIVLAVPLVSEGKLAPVWFAALVLGVLSSFEAAGPLAQLLPNLEQSVAAGNHLLENTLTDEENPLCREGSSLPPTNPPLPTDPSLAVKDLSFRYPASSGPALAGISFHLAPGQSLAVVGPSGSGKTTLVHLILRFWDDYQGTISYGGREIRTFSHDELWSRIGLISRQTHLFHATLRENLLLARPDAAEEELLHALQEAQLLPWVQTLPAGLDTSVGEEGSKLSGGQRQLLAIARAFLQDPPLFLLDEATEGLDRDTAEKALTAIRSLMKNRITLMVTHRLAEVHFADQLLVLRQGRRAGQGNSADLLQEEGLYRFLLELEREGSSWLS